MKRIHQEILLALLQGRFLSRRATATGWEPDWAYLYTRVDNQRVGERRVAQAAVEEFMSQKLLQHYAPPMTMMYDLTPAGRTAAMDLLAKRTLVATYSEECCEVWLRLDGDMEPRPCARRSVGTQPEWLSEAVSSDGWESLLNMPYQYQHGERVAWAIRRGLAPGLPFKATLLPPTFTSSWTDCGTEYDVEYNVNALEPLPSTPEATARRWEVWLWEEAELAAVRSRESAKREAERARVAELARMDASALFLTSEPYWGRYDSIDWIPSALRIRLESAHGGLHLAYGEDERGDREVAMRRLLEQAAKDLPHLRPEYIRALPYHRPLLPPRGAQE